MAYTVDFICKHRGILRFIHMLTPLPHNQIDCESIDNDIHYEIYITPIISNMLNRYVMNRNYQKRQKQPMCANIT